MYTQSFAPSTGTGAPYGSVVATAAAAASLLCRPGDAKDTPNLPTNIVPTNIARSKLSGESQGNPYGLGNSTPLN